MEANKYCYHFLATGNSDPALNAKLATVLNRAKAASMPKDNIETAVKKVCIHIYISCKNNLY